MFDLFRWFRRRRLARRPFPASSDPRSSSFRRELPVIFGDLFADYARTVRLDDDTTALRGAAAEAWKHAEAVRMTVDVAAQLLAAMIIARGPMSGPTMEVMVKRAVDAAQLLLAAFVTEGN